MEKNPLIEPENYFVDYQKSMEDMKNHPEIIEFDKLTYELFEMNEQGKRWLEIIIKRYIIPSIVKRGSATYQLDVLWSDGFKDFPRELIINVIKAHKQRIMAGK